MQNLFFIVLSLLVIYPLISSCAPRPPPNPFSNPICDYTYVEHQWRDEDEWCNVNPPIGTSFVWNDSYVVTGYNYLYYPQPENIQGPLPNTYAISDVNKFQFWNLLF